MENKRPRIEPGESNTQTQDEGLAKETEGPPQGVIWTVEMAYKPREKSLKRRMRNLVG